MKIIPSVFKSKTFKRLEKEWNKTPKLEVRPKSKDDKKKAKLLTKYVNWMFDTNAQGITSKYMKVMHLAQSKFLYEELNGILVSWDATERAVDQIIKEPKKYADMVSQTNTTVGKKTKGNKKI